jgi:hypothetical protein
MNERMSPSWRVELPRDEHTHHVGYYEHYRGISFHCTVEVDGSMIIYISEPSRWVKDYPWAALRRDEIVARVAQAAISPGRVATIDDEKGFIIVRKQSNAG